MTEADGPTGLLTTRSQVIATIRSPLGFFALALLIVESFLLCAGLWFGLPLWAKLVGLGVGVFLFVYVVRVVNHLVINHPVNLVFSEASHLQSRQLEIFGQKANPITVEVLNSTPVEGPPDVPPVTAQPEPRQLPAPSTADTDDVE